MNNSFSLHRISLALLSTSSRVLLIILLAISFSACSNVEDGDLPNYINEVKARGKSRIPPLPEPQNFEIFTYDDVGKRDPFVSIQIIEAAADSENGLRPDSAREKDVLEQYALGSLKMMGSLEKKGRLWALIRSPDGTLYRTRKGRHMGQNHGEITRITENKLELKEIVPDGLGSWIERISTLTANE